MLRRLHSLPGLALALLLAVTAASGAALSVIPALDKASTPALPAGRSVADLAGAIAARRPAVDRIVVRPGGVVTASFGDAEGGIEIVDPASGAALGPYRASETARWLTDLHRALLAGDAGRVAAACAALAMLGLSLSGAVLLARRAGSWRAMVRPMRGRPAQRWHSELGRTAVLALAFSSLTGLWMSAGTFGLLPDPPPPPVAAASSAGVSAPPAALAGLRATPLSDLRALTFPAADDPADVFVLRTAAGEASVDRVTGQVLAFAPTSAWERVSDVVVMLHTGRGAWVLGLALGLGAAGVPVLAATGAAIWWRRREGAGGLRGSVPAAEADIVVLVGSEGGTTWGFAATLQSALAAAGRRVHVAAMADLSEAHLHAGRLVVLTATAGDGGAPASARGFLDRLDRLEGRVPVAVLGFGDRTFPRFCGYAQAAVDALDGKGWPWLLAPKRIDRQSPQEFAAWGRDLGAALGCGLDLQHRAQLPPLTELVLLEREDYGAAVDAPVAILRFVAATREAGGRGRLPGFSPGDLVGVVPPDSAMPRFYSLASASSDGVLEICVRLRPGGACSGFLHSLEPGGRIAAFIRENPAFRPAVGRSPLILIGAGAGVGPLAGFVRANAEGRPVHLYFGGRSPASDFLYEHEFAQHLAERRLTSLTTAFSRAPDAAYVQDRLAADAPQLRELIRHGAQVLVCGGRDMAQSVSRTLDRILHPLGTDLATLRSAGRYVEDVY
ncbi:MAG: PepSY domain-containing protein [Alsobacter sp.]